MGKREARREWLGTDFAGRERTSALHVVVALAALALIAGCAGASAASPTLKVTEPSECEQRMLKAERECAWGSPEECVLLGELERYGACGSQKSARAVDAYGRACELGSALGCFTLGEMTMVLLQLDPPAEPKAREAATERMRSYYRRACDSGYLLACVFVGLDLSERAKDLGVAGDHEDAKQLFADLCGKGRWDGCMLYAVRIVGDKEEGGYELAESLLEKGCAANEREACHVLGVYLTRGMLRAAAHDGFGRATHALGRACDLGQGDGCYELAALRLERSRTESPERGAESEALALAAVDQGCRLAIVASARACALAADLHQNGKYTPHNAELAQAFAHRARELERRPKRPARP
jgi:hypothetical protein